MDSGGDTIRVVIVDHDRLMAGLCGQFVDGLEGFEVVREINTGAGALHVVAATRPDLVVMDIDLLDMSGLEVLRQLRHDGSAVDVFVTTASADPAAVQACLHAGVLQYLVKPFSGTTLRERLVAYQALRSSIRTTDGEQLSQQDVDAVFSAARPEVAGGSAPVFIQRPCPPTEPHG